MKEEPVAYVNNMCNDSIDWKVDPMELEEGTPLYTTPQTKPLSDEEITKILTKIPPSIHWQYDFAHAIENKIRGIDE